MPLLLMLSLLLMFEAGAFVKGVRSLPLPPVVAIVVVGCICGGGGGRLTMVPPRLLAPWLI